MLTGKNNGIWRKIWNIGYMITKKLWRSVSKEAELHRIEHVICQYADWLRVFDKICD